ncbi:hypothetical protein KIN20_023161 [Parelaphostrongylus tenuis]|uniref:Secreted protein n=1 Tax=Parelaphostrongylus tenuis TaxID=148309 RepID=A0AAD5N8R2_PARTN|nr:hypothetical protein KIN20_023161 [Parelaphostrongylus tenuis]
MLPILLWFSSLLAWDLLAYCHDTSRYDNSVIHTFDTREMCMSRCRTVCSQHHSEDLMMPRWHCPAQLLQKHTDTK